MTSRLSLLCASTALTVALGLPALAALQTQGNVSARCSGVCAVVSGADDLSVPLIRVSGDGDDEEGGRVRREDDDNKSDDCNDDDDCVGPGGRGNPAPAGTVAPPANGLFGNGAPPVAVTN